MILELKRLYREGLHAPHARPYALLLCLAAAWLLPLSLPVSARGGPAGNAAGPYQISIDTSPPPIGQGEIVVRVRDRATGRPPAGGSLFARASMTAMPMGETFHRASPDAEHPGTYRLPWSFQMAGDWKIEAEFRGPKGVSDAAAPVSPGAVAFPLWAKILMGLVGAGALVFLAGLARTPNGRERLRTIAGVKNLLVLLLLAAIATGAWLLVRHFKAGQIDWNQMSMQMEDYTSPAPVSVQPAAYGLVSGEITYTGSVVPFVEETVYSRVTGRVTSALYAGDRVRPGQVVAQLDEPDITAKAEQARFGVESAAHDVLEAQDRVQQARDAVASARAALQAAGGGVEEAAQTEIGAGGAVAAVRSDRDAAIQDHQAALSDLQAAESGVAQAQAALLSARADAGYWKQEIPREASLLAHGAVSQDEYQGEVAKSQAAQAAVDSAQADVARAESALGATRARVASSSAKIRSLSSRILEAQAGRGSQGGKLVQAKAAVQSARAGLATTVNGVTVAEHQVDHSRAMLDVARAAQAEAGANVGYLTVRSAAGGVVIRRLADPGTVVIPGTAILKIAQVDRVRLQANVSTTDLDKIHPGTPVTAEVQGLGKTINARVTDVFPSASETTRTAIVEAAVPNPDGLLLPGAFVTLHFHTAVTRRVLVVPLTAVVSMAQAGGAAGTAGEGTGQGAGGGSGVWTVVDGAAHLSPVTTGASDGVNQEILSGLKPGDLVIVGGIEGLTEGAAVTYPGMPQISPPAQAPGPVEGKPATEGLSRKAGNFTVSLAFDPSPPRAGDETLRFTVTGVKGAPVNGARVEVTTEMPTMSMSGPSGVAKDNGDGIYSLPISMGMGADWRVVATIIPPGGPSARAVFNFKVQ